MYDPIQMAEKTAMVLLIESGTFEYHLTRVSLQVLDTNSKLSRYSSRYGGRIPLYVMNKKQLFCRVHGVHMDKTMTKLISLQKKLASYSNIIFIHLDSFSDIQIASNSIKILIKRI